MSTLSVVVSAFNEEKRIGECLSSVSWADELIVVDNESTDATKKIAEKNGAHVISRPNLQMLNKNKNVGFLEAKSDWILNLDADEVVSPELAEDIKKITSEESSLDGYWIPRKNIIFGKWIRHGLWWPDKQLRLFRRGKGKFPCVHVHEYLTVEGKVGELTEPFVHYNYQTISQFLHKLDTIYTENEVSNNIKAGYKLSWRDALGFPISDFVKIYFAQEGYKDGLHGLVLAILQAFYAFIIFAKCWEQVGFTEQEVPLKAVTTELAKKQKDIQYWSFSALLTHERNPLKRLLLRLSRKYVSAH